MSGADWGAMNAPRETDVEAWRTALTYAKPAALGEVDWPRVLGWVLDDLERVRSEVTGLQARIDAAMAELDAADARERAMWDGRDGPYPGPAPMQARLVAALLGAAVPDPGAAS